jgi:glycosyltransferase involved in cell wall biosynthesis
MKPTLSVIISTYNRSRSLTKTIESILSQSGTFPFELIIVDNNSDDETQAVIRSFTRKTPIVRYVFEGQQGNSHGRNAGIAAAQSDFFLFTDDDVIPSKDWLERAAATFESRPDHGCIGGKVLPIWPCAPPEWLTSEHWGPLALLDREEGITADSANRKCLITANMGVRRAVFEEVGVFRPQFQKVAGSTSSIEDRELQERYWEAGGRCWFDPLLIVHADVQPTRLTKGYHRRWHYEHGRLNALLRDPDLERSGHRVLGVPGHIYRRLAIETARMFYLNLRGSSAEAFAHEVSARFCAGFTVQRILGDQLTKPPQSSINRPPSNDRK